MILYGTTTNTSINFHSNAFLLKLDANGNTITHTQSPENSNINIYPNPFSDHIFIENTPAISNIQIIDNTGKILFIADKLQSNTILTSHFSKGFYILKYQYKNKIYTKKIVKE